MGKKICVWLLSVILLCTNVNITIFAAETGKQKTDVTEGKSVEPVQDILNEMIVEENTETGSESQDSESAEETDTSDDAVDEDETELNEISETSDESVDETVEETDEAEKAEGTDTVPDADAATENEAAEISMDAELMDVDAGTIIASGELNGGAISWALNSSGILTISGTGDMPYVHFPYNPWQKYYADIKTVIISEGITSVGDYAFYKCGSNITNVSLPNGLLRIGKWAFCGHNVSSISIPESVTTIDESAFRACKSLSTISIPANVTDIGESAFSFCTSLTSINIPQNVSHIGEGAFSYCDSLSNITVEADNTVYDSRNDCNAIIETSTNTLINGCNNTDIPNTVTSIGRAAFAACSGLTEVTIPSGVKSIGPCAFCECSGLTSLSLPESITSIGYGAFSDCSNLSNVNIPTKITSITSELFSNCKNLSAIIIPEGITSIETQAFSGCSSLSSIDIPASVTSIDNSTFSYCKNLNSILVNTNNSVYDSRNNCNAIIETNSNTLISGCKNTIIPNTVSIIGMNAFEGCASLTSISIPTSVTVIGEYAFSECGELVSINIPKDVTNIEDGAFLGCTSLPAINVPAKVTHIGEQVFSHCSKLTSITVDSENTKYDSRNNCNAIIESNSNTLLYGCKNTEIPSGILTIGECSFKGCGDLTYIYIPLSVTSIEYHAFAHCDLLQDIYYEGSEASWNNISIDYDEDTDDNSTYAFAVASIHYNSTPPKPEDKPDDNLIDYGEIEEGDKPDTGQNIPLDYWIAGVKDTEYTGKAITFDDLRVYYANKLLTKNVDYSVKYRNNVKVGTASVIITGKGNYSGNKTVTFSITAAKDGGTSIAKAKVSGWKKTQIYTGNALTQTAEISLNGTKLEEGLDYRVDYKNNVNTGTATVLYRGIGNYCGTVQKTFKITALDINGKDVFESECVSPVPIVKGGAVTKVIVKHNGKVLKEGKDYILTFKNNKKTGTASYTIKGKGNFKGSVKGKDFEITTRDIEGLTVQVPDVAYKNKAKIYKSKPTVYDADGKTLKAGTDYERTFLYTYVNDTKIGDKTVPAGTEVKDTDIIPVGTQIKVTVTGKGNYGKDNGKTSGNFRIIEATKNIKSGTVKISGDVYYTGTPVTLEKSQISVRVKKIVLSADDFEIISYANNTKKGTAKVTIHGTGSYGGTKTVTFKIKAKTIR